MVVPVLLLLVLLSLSLSPWSCRGGRRASRRARGRRMRRRSRALCCSPCEAAYLPTTLRAFAFAQTNQQIASVCACL